MPELTPITQAILEALRGLRHAVDRAYTNPDFARQGLILVLDTAGPHLISVLNRCDREAEAGSLSRAITNTSVEGSPPPNALIELLAAIDRLLICLPLGTKPITRRQRMALAEADPNIRAYPKQLPEEETNPSLEVDLERGCLTYGPQSYETGSKIALQILSILNTHRNSPCSAQQLMGLAWAERIVTDDAVRKQVGQAGKLLAEVTRDLKIAQRRGYGWELVGVSSEG